MPPLARGALLALVCLGGTSATAQPAMEREGTRCIELEARPSERAPAVGLSPESSTTLMFDVDLVREEVELEERERFAFVDVGERSIVLQPSSRQRTEKPLRLEVRFRGGQSPERTVLWLTVGPEQAEARVRVLRQGRCTEETMRAELARLQEENQRLRAELEQRNEMPGPVSLIQLRTEERMDAAGVATRDISKDVRLTQGEGLSRRKAFSYRARERVAVELVLRNTGATEPWSADKAALVGPGGEELEVLAVWMNGPISPGGNGQLLVEAAGKPGPGSYTLRVWKSGSERVLILDNVKFPGPVSPRPGGRP